MDVQYGLMGSNQESVGEGQLLFLLDDHSPERQRDGWLVTAVGQTWQRSFWRRLRRPPGVAGEEPWAPSPSGLMPVIYRWKLTVIKNSPQDCSRKGKDVLTQPFRLAGPQCLEAPPSDTPPR